MKINLPQVKHKSSDTNPADPEGDKGPRCECGSITTIMASSNGPWAVCRVCGTERALPRRAPTRDTSNVATKGAAIWVISLSQHQISGRNRLRLFMHAESVKTFRSAEFALRMWD